MPLKQIGIQGVQGTSQGGPSLQEGRGRVGSEGSAGSSALS